ncbi:hypothetical protein [Mesorhizobium sp.]|uniref:hypothetical protein n=1 Tax=Mesorhizobium sp. TaxID=1871066 RepID=UPI000FE4F6D9|nr:hypothetical protein [Mesorhizobium sp.]RWM84327.1 MAG: hypothetical protein EOR83_17045 [Mesorhizobium sp.]
MAFNEFTNDSLPSDLKVTARGGQIILKFRTATVILSPEGALAMAAAIQEVSNGAIQGRSR